MRDQNRNNAPKKYSRRASSVPRCILPDQNPRKRQCMNTARARQAVYTANLGCTRRTLDPTALVSECATFTDGIWTSTSSKLGRDGITRRRSSRPRAFQRVIDFSTGDRRATPHHGVSGNLKSPTERTRKTKQKNHRN